MSRSEQEADEGEKVLMVREKEKGGRGKAGGDGGRHAFKRVRRGWGGGDGRRRRVSVRRRWQGAPRQVRWDADAWARPLCVGLNRFKLEFKQI
jgi:hypothetical protein